MRSLAPLFLAPALALALAACGSVADRGVSQSGGLDCELARLLGDQAMCQSATGPKPPAKIYCYRTLGSIDCYPEPNPDGGLALRPEGAAATRSRAAAVTTPPTTSAAVPQRKPVAAIAPAASAKNPPAGDMSKPTKKAKSGGKLKPVAKLKPLAPPKAKLAPPGSMDKPPASSESKDDKGSKDNAAKEPPKKAPVAKARGLPARKPARPAAASDDAEDTEDTEDTDDDAVDDNAKQG